jgi:murein DD-endopeptidase MepM/ murein hydrolase activator NlpD
MVERDVHQVRLAQDENLAHALARVGADGETSRQILQALAGSLDFRKIRVGDELALSVEGSSPQALTYRHLPIDEWRVNREGTGWVGHKRQVTVVKRLARIEVQIAGSLYESLARTGADPELSLALAEVFAWDVDFYSDVQPGDTVRALVEEDRVQGKVIRYGEVQGAEYVGHTVGDKKVFRFVDASGEASYFGPDGQSARKTFLKSPLKYAHITSTFGMRMHPVLKYEKAHEGVDYGAPPGTPVWAVGDGQVTFAAPKGANGNMVCLKHRNGLETCYCHLKGFGAGIRAGVRVVQKRVIGYVGTTGRSTGPHLHYALKQSGHFLNPLTQKFPRAEPVPPEQLADFHRQVDPVAAALEPVAVAQASVPLSQ